MQPRLAPDPYIVEDDLDLLMFLPLLLEGWLYKVLSMMPGFYNPEDQSQGK